MSGGFRHLPHTADVLIEAWGKSLEEAFEYAALAVFEVMTDVSRVKPKEERKVEAEGFDLESLLYDWIEELLFLFDSEGLLLSKFKVQKVTERKGEYELLATVWGERYDPQRHESRTVVKAMTYHLMKIEIKPGSVKLRFVVDI